MAEWVVLDECANEGIYCSECHKKIYTLDFAKKVKCKFCPNCGADMRQAQAEGEYISRTAIEYINAPIAPVIQGEEVHYEWVAFRKQIEQLPSVAIPTAEPKTGHWIEHPEIETSTPEYLMFYECSECGDKQCFCKSDIHKKHFCNNCGARMFEPQERSE